MYYIADIKTLIGIIVFIPIIAYIIYRLINFLPVFVASFVNSIKNKSIIYDKDTVDNNQLDLSNIFVEKDEKNNV